MFPEHAQYDLPGLRSVSLINSIFCFRRGWDGKEEERGSELAAEKEFLIMENLWVKTFNSETVDKSFEVKFLKN